MWECVKVKIHTDNIMSNKMINMRQIKMDKEVHNTHYLNWNETCNSIVDISS